MNLGLGLGWFFWAGAGEDEDEGEGLMGWGGVERNGIEAEKEGWEE